MDKGLFNKVSWPPSGKYVLTVSGGVDSVVLLDLMALRSSQSKAVSNKQPAEPAHNLPTARYQLIVAHFDHGMRADSAKDARFVGKLADGYGLPFIVARGRLNEKSTEEAARTARYKFLRTVASQHGAINLITAHHFDDALETAVFNAGRGADNFGLTPMHLAASPIRPLLGITKAQLIDYANRQQLRWHEDPTNQSPNLARNLIRHQIIPAMPANQIEQFKKLIEANLQIHASLSAWLAKYCIGNHRQQTLRRVDFLLLPPADARLVIKIWLNIFDTSVEGAQLERIVAFAKTAAPGKTFQLGAKLRAYIADDMITLAKSA